MFAKSLCKGAIRERAALFATVVIAALHGGTSPSGAFNDAWSFDPATGNWTWIKGSSDPDEAGRYGVQGLPGASNTPGCRIGAVAAPDRNGGVRPFGGFGLDGGAEIGNLNDLWSFALPQPDAARNRNAYLK